MKGSSQRKCKKCKAAIRWDSHVLTKYCRKCAVEVHNSSSLVDERGRMNAKPTVDARCHPDHDVVTSHECWICGKPHEGSIDNGFFCPECKKNRILDIHKEIDRRNAALAMHEQKEQRDYYNRRRAEGTIAEAYKNRPGGKAKN